MMVGMVVQGTGAHVENSWSDDVRVQYSRCVCICSSTGSHIRTLDCKFNLV